MLVACDSVCRMEFVRLCVRGAWRLRLGSLGVEKTVRYSSLVLFLGGLFLSRAAFVTDASLPGPARKNCSRDGSAQNSDTGSLFLSVN